MEICNTKYVTYLQCHGISSIPQRNTPQSSDYSVIHGLRAIEALAEPTEYQMNLMMNHEAANITYEKIPNKDRVICITSARDNPSMKSLQDIFHNVLMQQNTLAMSQKKSVVRSCMYV